MHEVIEECIAAGTWRYLVATSDWAFSKDIQYTIFRLVQELEPERRYGYKKRLLRYLVENHTVTIGGGYSLTLNIDERTIIYALQEMEREISV